MSGHPGIFLTFVFSLAVGACGPSAEGAAADAANQVAVKKPTPQVDQGIKAESNEFDAVMQQGNVTNNISSNKKLEMYLAPSVFFSDLERQERALDIAYRISAKVATPSKLHRV
jgi:hypothetical protein